jgi:Ca2+-binding EF-hand superfamily protein
MPSLPQVFAEFDENGSGFLDYDEFSRMLPALGIHLPPSKVVRL